MTVKEYLLQYKALTLKAAQLKAEYDREQSEIDEIRFLFLIKKLPDVISQVVSIKDIVNHYPLRPFLPRS